MKGIHAIPEKELEAAKVAANLPDRPSQAGLYSAHGMTPQEIKEAFDRLPLLLASYYNGLIESLPGVSDGNLSDDGLSAKMLTNLKNGHTLKDLLEDIATGDIASYLRVAENVTLAEFYSDVLDRIAGTGDEPPTSDTPGEEGKLYVCVEDASDLPAFYLCIGSGTGGTTWKALGSREKVRQTLKKKADRLDLHRQKIPFENNGTLNTTGVFYPSENGRTTDWVSTEGVNFIHVIGRCVSNCCMLAFYDVNKTFMGDISIPGTVDGDYVNEVIDLRKEEYANAAFFRFCVYEFSRDFSMFRCEISGQSDILSPSAGRKKPDILIFGDTNAACASITVDSNMRSTRYHISYPQYSYTNSQGETVKVIKWPELLKSAMFCRQMRNYATGGATYRDQSSTTVLKSLSKQVELALNDIGNTNGIFPQDDFDPDIVIFSLGGNDGYVSDTAASAIAQMKYTSSGVFDAEATYAALDRSKFCQAALYAFLKIKVAFPKAVCFCVTPMQWSGFNPNTEVLHDALCQLAHRTGILVIDATYESGVLKENEQGTGGVFLQSGMYPNKLGQNRLLSLIHSAIDRYYYSDQPPYLN